MKKKLNPEMVDDENPEWTAAMLSKSVRFHALRKLITRMPLAISVKTTECNLSPSKPKAENRTSV